MALDNSAVASEVQVCLQAALPGVAQAWSTFQGQERVVVPASNVLDFLKACRDRAAFDQLIDLTCVDLLELPGSVDRFEIVYCLLSVESGVRLIVKTYLNEPNLTLPSATQVWFGADWLEREAYDMFGIVFEGHPNFKRLLLPDEFVSFPLRKDYPQQGRGERHNFPIITRSKS
jgi:NADH-quinone oxidoreductase subunit C